MTPDKLTLGYLYDLAIAWCPKTARWNHLLDWRTSWGATHELAHILIEPKWRWEFASYNRCGLGYCTCGRDLCDVYEAAAMTISGRILRSMGLKKLASLEIQQTVDYDFLLPHHYARGKTLLKRKRLWPVPVTPAKIEAALKRRVGKPQGGKPKPIKAWNHLVEAILGPA